MSIKSYQELVQEARARLTSVSDTPQLDAEVLLAHVLEVERIWLIAHGSEPATLEATEKFGSLVERRTHSEPVAYLVEKREFFGRDFLVTPDVLIPRPETELLVEKALDFICKRVEQSEKKQRLLELGSGSGCIIVSLLAELQEKGVAGQVEATAVDISEDALAVARYNVESLCPNSTVDFICSDWFASLPADGSYDCIVANPPYVAPQAELSADLGYEPRLALFSEEGGLKDPREIIADASLYLTKNGRLFLECGIGQAEVLAKEAQEQMEKKWSATLHSDLQGIKRVMELYQKR